ncbi:MAG TPA: hydrogenase iron-sulfur subunit [Smithella sp.]|nr:hydrogenase iron-sulfur subunit [Smithella sp.]
MEGDRTIFTWVSASEGDRWAQVIKGATEKIKALGPANKLIKKID